MPGRLLIAAIFTIVIETLFLAAVGYRDKDFVFACVLINFVTNICLNVGLSFMHAPLQRVLQYPLEGIVVMIEWAVLGFFVRSRKKLLLFVFLSNLLSFSAGILIFQSGCLLH